MCRAMRDEMLQSMRVRKLRDVLTHVSQARAYLDLIRDRDHAEDEACRLIELAQRELAEVQLGLSRKAQEQEGARNTKGVP